MASQKLLLQRLNPSSSPRLQFPEHSSPGRRISADNTSAQSTMPILPVRWSPSLRAIANLMFIYGLRVSEILRIRYAHISDDGFIYIISSKGSHDKIIWYPDILALCGHPQNYSNDFLFKFKYNQIYRSFLKAGFSVHSRPNKQYQTVTHIFRVNRFNLLSNKYHPNPETLMRFTGHKTTKGFGYYLSKNFNTFVQQPITK